jgi:putative hydrolase of the HAD superfamily
MSSNGTGLQAVIFDYGKVLTFAPTEADWRALAEKCGVPFENFQSLYWGHRDAYDRAETNASIYWRQVAAGAGALIKNDGIVSELTRLDNQQWTRENPDMVEFARAVKQAGLKTAILSNMQHDMLKALRSKFDWLSEFDVQVYSCEIGIVKPSVEIYQKCCEMLGVLPKNSAFLDDKTPNIEGAEKVGIRALLFEGQRGQAEKFIFNGNR